MDHDTTNMNLIHFVESPGEYGRGDRGTTSPSRVYAVTD